MGNSDAELHSAREYCYRCMRVGSMCLCDLFPPCDNRTEIHVLQHDRERRHAFGTVRLLAIGLRRLHVHRMPHGVVGSPEAPMGFPDSAGVLYPGEGSLDLAQLTPEQRPGKLVVIDGTWSQAHCMYRDSPWLHKLPRFSLAPKEPSRYRIRKEPRFECLSTLESTAMALRLLEPETAGIDNLLRIFDCMVDRQLECIERHRASPKRMKSRRVAPMRAVHPAIWQETSNVVIVYAESALPRSRRERQYRELAQWSAVRLDGSEEVFDAIVDNEEHHPSGYFLEELGWTEKDLQGVEPLLSAQRRWQEFVRPNDVFVAWNKGTAKLATQHELVDHVVVMKESYGNTHVGSVGTLEEVVAREGLTPKSGLAIAGRAQNRLANAQAVARYLEEWARQRLRRS